MCEVIETCTLKTMRYRMFLPILCAVFAVWVTILHCGPIKLPPEKNKLILSWVPFFGSPSFFFGNGTSDVFKAFGCEYSACEIVYDPRRVPLDQFDALLFHGFEDYEILFGTPRIRDPKQIYVYLTFEAARRNYIPERERNFFNMTITYRLDSDVPWPYFHIFDSETNTIVAPDRNPNWTVPIPPEKGSKFAQEIETLVAGKEKMAAWFVSNCHSKSGREEFVRKLGEHGIAVDIYGYCGPLTCPWARNDECVQMLNKYYFYLGFENSLCEDYVTEKAVIGFQGGAVPIILSGANLTRFLPPGSYLDAQALGPKALSIEMKRLASQPDVYSQMFWWRQNYYLGKMDWKTRQHPFCELCKTLHEGKVNTKRKIDVRDWWHLSSDGSGSSCIII